MLMPAAASDLLLAIAAFVIVLFPAIIIHELGHFFAARLVGINVLEFGIGFPPRITRLFFWRETQFTLNLLPIGGFVRPLGEDMIGPASDDKVKRDRDDLEARRLAARRAELERELLRLCGIPDHKMMTVSEAPALGRIFFMAAGALANFASAILLFIVAALFGLMMPVGGLSQIAAIPEGSLFDGTGAQVGDAIERIDGERFADFGAFHDILAEYSGEQISFSLLRHETEESFVVTVRPDFASRAGAVQVLGVLEESPAAQAGILPGDLVTQISNVSIPSSGDPAQRLSQAARESEGRPLPLTVYREHDDGNAEVLRLVVTPRANPPEGEGRLGIAIRSQFGLGEGTRFANAGYVRESVPQSIPDAIAYGFRTTGETFSLIASIPGRLLDGSLSGEDARPISIIGISKIGGEFLQRSFSEGPSLMLHFVALISIFLGITNLLPIPALDGGRILFVLLEMLRGKPVNPRLEARVHHIGIVLLLLLGSLVMIYDLINPPSIS